MYLWLINFIIIYVDKYLSSQNTMLINIYASLILLFINIYYSLVKEKNNSNQKISK